MIEAVDESAEPVADGGENDEPEDPEWDSGDDGDNPEYESEDHATDCGKDEEYFEPKGMGTCEWVDEFVVWLGEFGFLRVSHWGSFAA